MKTKIPIFNYYYIDEEGNIYSYYDNIFKKLKTRVNLDGYNSITIQGKTYVVHYLMAITYLTNPEKLPYIIHKNNNRRDDRLSNIKYSKRTYKSEQYYSIPRNITGTPFGKKLTDNEVIAIRTSYLHSNLSQRDLSEIFNVSKSTIRNILKNKTYKNILI